MIKDVLVTIRCMEREFDMELSADMELRRLKPAVLEAMRHEGICLDGSFIFESNGHPLKETDTLLEAGVWDGSYLDIL